MVLRWLKRNARPNGWVFVDIEGRDLGSCVGRGKKVVSDQIVLARRLLTGMARVNTNTWSVPKNVYVVAPITIAIITLLLYLSFRRVGEVMTTMLDIAYLRDGWRPMANACSHYNFSIAVRALSRLPGLLLR